MRSNLFRLTLGLTLALSTASMAQLRTLTVPVENYPEQYMDFISSLPSDLPDAIAPSQNSNEESIRPNNVRGGGGAIWSEDFGNGFPTGWGVDDASGINPWKWTTNGSHGYWNNSNGGDYADPINSTTAGNGFLISDPDSANHFNYGQPSGTTYEYLESYFVTNAIDLGMSYSSLLLEFEQSFRFNNSLDLMVMVSPDSVNWTEYTVQGGVGNNTASADPDLASINISGAVGSSQTVYLKIGWNARVYFWMIDDMRIVEGLGDDLVIEKVYHGNVIEDWEYEITPLAQTSSKEIGVYVTNNGGNTQTNVTCNYAILFDGDTVADGSFIVDDGTIEPAVTDTGWYDTGFVPSEIGLYTVNYTIVSDATDEEPSDNMASRDFEISEDEWSHEREVLWDGQYGGYIVPDTDPQELEAYSHGILFVPVVDAELLSMKVSFGDLTNASSGSPLALTAEVHTIGQNIQDIVDSEIESFDIEGDGWQTHVFDDPIELTAGVGYILAVSTLGGEDIITIDGWGVDDDFAASNYGPFGTGGAENWYNGWDYSSAIRAVFESTSIGVDELDGEIASFVLFPNPTSDYVKVVLHDNTGGESLSVVDITGKLVTSMSLSTQVGSFDLDVSDLDAGVYFVNVTTEGGNSSRKLIVQ